MANLKTILDVEIEERSAKLANLEPGTKEYSDAVDGLTKLMDRRIEIEKFEAAEAQSEQQLKEERKSRLSKNLIDIGLGLAGLGLTAWGMCVSIQFEKDDSFTSQLGKRSLDRILKK